MLKHSHYIVACRISDVCKVSRLYKYCLICGSIIPDLKLSCFIKPHMHKNWRNYTNKLMDKLIKQNKSLSYYYRFGKLLHLYSDFYTRPHSFDDFHAFLSHHAKWEIELDKQITSSFSLSSEVSFDSLNELRDLYKNEINNYIGTFNLDVSIDLKYIESVCFYLCKEVGLLRCLKISMSSENLITS